MSTQRPRKPPPPPPLKPRPPAPNLDAIAGALLTRGLRFEVTRNSAGAWFWHLLSNGKKIATSGESFASKANAYRAAQNVKAKAGGAPIKIVE